MLDVFLDMTKLSSATLADDDGGMCAVGAAAWTAGCPFDVLRSIQLGEGNSIDKGNKASEFIRGAGARVYNSEYIFVHYDSMCRKLALGGYSDARTEALDLISEGLLRGINFIIASPLPTRTWRIRKQQRRAAQQLELTAH